MPIIARNATMAARSQRSDRQNVTMSSA